MTSIWVRVNGSPLTEIAAHTPPSWETNADGGCTTASFALALGRRSQHRDLRPGVLVEIMQGPLPVWTGLLTEPDRSTWQCHAEGLSASLGTYLALDGANQPTRELGTAISQAIARGWRGSNPLGIAGPVAGDATGNAVMVAALCDDYANQIGTRWGVDGRGRLYMRPDPVSPKWLTAPDSALFVPTSENTPRLLAGDYTTADGKATAVAGSGTPEATTDITDMGEMTQAAAEAVLAGMLLRTGSSGWANSVTLHREQLTTTGGVPANLAAVRGGQMLRAHGLAYVVSSRAPWLNVTIGKTSYVAGADTITIEPVNTAPRDFTSVLAAA